MPAGTTARLPLPGVREGTGDGHQEPGNLTCGSGNRPPGRAAGMERQRRVGSWAEAPEPSRGFPAPRPWGRGCPILGPMMLPKVWEHLTVTGWPEAGGTATTSSSEEMGSQRDCLSPIRGCWAGLLPPLGSICLGRTVPSLSPGRAHQAPAKGKTPARLSGKTANIRRAAGSTALIQDSPLMAVLISLSAGLTSIHVNEGRVVGTAAVGPGGCGGGRGWSAPKGAVAAPTSLARVGSGCVPQDQLQHRDNRVPLGQQPPSRGVLVGFPGQSSNPVTLGNQTGLVCAGSSERDPSPPGPQSSRRLSSAQRSRSGLRLLRRGLVPWRALGELWLPSCRGVGVGGQLRGTRQSRRRVPSPAHGETRPQPGTGSPGSFLKSFSVFELFCFFLFLP